MDHANWTFVDQKIHREVSGGVHSCEHAFEIAVIGFVHDSLPCNMACDTDARENDMHKNCLVLEVAFAYGHISYDSGSTRHVLRELRE